MNLAVEQIDRRFSATLSKHRNGDTVREFPELRRLNGDRGAENVEIIKQRRSLGSDFPDGHRSCYDAGYGRQRTATPHL
jgi:hypothetical protein